jgi:hypothetical protein
VFEGTAFPSQVQGTASGFFGGHFRHAMHRNSILAASGIQAPIAAKTQM